MVRPSACPGNTDQELSRPNVELSDVVRRFGRQYRSQYGHRMLPSQKRALADIEACCTKQLGGRVYRCGDCSESFWVYHSCRNRACPKCHAKQTQQWLAKRQAELLPCDYWTKRLRRGSGERFFGLAGDCVGHSLVWRVILAGFQPLCGGLDPTSVTERVSR